MQYKVAKVEERIQVFEVRVVNNVSQQDCLIVLRKNINEVSMLEIESRDKKQLVPWNHVKSAVHLKKEKVFKMSVEVEYGRQQAFEFTGREHSSLETYLKVTDFIDRAKEAQIV